MTESRSGELERILAELETLDPEERTYRLDRLEREDPRAGSVVRLRFFAGLEFPELVALLGRSERSLKRDWAAARAALHAMME